MAAMIALLIFVALLGVTGKPNPMKVVGGEQATRNEFPSLVQIQLNGFHLCGGTIYSREWVITAAHCAMSGPITAFTIVAGEHNISAVDGSEQIRSVVRIVWHHLYQSPNALEFENDVAVMQVSPPFNFNMYVQPASIPHEGFIPPANATIAGWGTLSEGGDYASALQKGTVFVVSDSVCNEAYRGAIAPSMICAEAPGRDSCTGDSGGPFYCGQGHLCGVISWALGCARPGYPGVNTEMSYFSEWTFETVHNSPIVDQTIGCGGSLVGASGKVAYKLNENYNNYERCVWSIRTNDRETIVIRLESEGFAAGDYLTVNEFDYAKGTIGRVSRLNSRNPVFVVSGPLVVITFSSDEQFTGNGFSLNYQTEGAIDVTQLNYFQHHISNLSGTFHYPPTTPSYYNNELSTVIINPNADQGLVYLEFKVDFIDLEESAECSLDVLNVCMLGWRDSFVCVFSLCGTNPEHEEFKATEGPLLLVLRTDESVTRSGYTISWRGVL